MINSVVASLALFGASAAAQSVGRAHVVNKCSYDVYLCNVPASGGGFEQEDKYLSSGETWDQEWTALSNDNGWSIKLSKSEALENILQYEYTFHNDGTIWYDLSCVNGNPWDKNWEITSSTANCNPKQQAYRYATDDAYGMQDCPQDASITVTLCSGEAADNSTSGSDGSDSDSGYDSPSDDSDSYPDGYSTPSTTYETPASTPTMAAPSIYYNWNNEDASSWSAAHAPEPTTMATVVTKAPDGVTITQYETAIVTDVVTAYAGRVKPRHQHHARGHEHAA